jgi:hypothetical protein
LVPLLGDVLFQLRGVPGVWRKSTQQIAGGFSIETPGPEVAAEIRTGMGLLKPQ